MLFSLSRLRLGNSDWMAYKNPNMCCIYGIPLRVTQIALEK